MKSSIHVKAESSQLTEGQRTIDWNDFNYPICLRIFHYNSEETPEVYRRKVMLLRANHIAILFTCLFNFITNIISAAQGLSGGVIRVIISIFLIFLWTPISFYIFMIPYRIIMGKEGKQTIFYLLSLITFIWFFIWSIADFADANGFVMVAHNATNDRGAAAFFGAITAIVSLTIAVATVINAIFFCRRDK